MREYLLQLKSAVRDKDDRSLNNLSASYLDELKKCLEHNDIKVFKSLTSLFFDDVFKWDKIFHDSVIKFLYDLIDNENYDFFTNCKFRNYLRILNGISHLELEKLFENLDFETKLLIRKVYPRLQEEITMTILDMNYDSFKELLTTKGIFSVMSLKDKFSFCIKRSLYQVRVLLYILEKSVQESSDFFSIISEDLTTPRQYLPNRIYTDEMFEFTTDLYNDPQKRRSQQEALIETLEKFNLSTDKWESYKVQWNSYRRTKKKK